MARHAPQFEQADQGHQAIGRRNDALRANLTQPGRKHVVMTGGIGALIGDVSLLRGFCKRAELMRTVRDFEHLPCRQRPLWRA